jgi:hypothetical protein
MSDTFDNGVTLYTVTLRLPDARAAAEWDWPALIDEPDARPLDVRGNLLTIQFSNDYPGQDDPSMHEGNPMHWHWADLLDTPGVRCTKVTETPNLDYRRSVTALAVGALRDYRAAMAESAALHDKAAETDDLDDMVRADNATSEVWENYCDLLADNLGAVLDAIGVKA